MRFFGRLAPAMVASIAMIVALTACSPITALNALAPARTHTVTTGIAYGDGPRRMLDVYRPTSAAPPGGWPVVVFFYGGSWNSGDRADYEFFGEALASRGMVAVLPDYRLYPEVRYPDFLKDSAAALAWGLEHAASLGGNTARVYVMGHSAGGYNAAMLALDPRWLSAVGHAPSELAGFIGLAGPYNFLPTTNKDVQPVFFHPNYPSDSQPLFLATAAAPRTFLGAARKDDIVYPEQNTEPLAARLEALGVPVTMKLYDRVNHVTLAGAFALPLRWLAPVLDDVASFVDEDGRAAPEKR